MSVSLTRDWYDMWHRLVDIFIPGGDRDSLTNIGVSFCNDMADHLGRLFVFSHRSSDFISVNTQLVSQHIVALMSCVVDHTVPAVMLLFLVSAHHTVWAWTCSSVCWLWFCPWGWEGSLFDFMILNKHLVFQVDDPVKFTMHNWTSKVQILFASSPSIHPVGTSDYFSRDKSGHSWSWSTPLSRAQVKNVWSFKTMPPLYLYDIVFRHSDNLIYPVRLHVWKIFVLLHYLPTSKKKFMNGR